MRRPLKKTYFKGPVFPSFIHQEPGRRLVWSPGAQSTRQQIRNLKNRCRVILDSRDPDVRMMGLRVMRATQHEPNPEFGALHLMASGLDISEQTGESWLTSTAYLLEKFQQMEQGGADASVDTSR